MNADFKIGDIVYSYDAWWGVCKVKITKIENDSAWITFLYGVDRDGNQKDDYKHGGTCGRFLNPDEKHKLCGIWRTAKEVYDILDVCTAKTEADLRSSIMSIEDLLRFPFENCLCGEDVDYSAIKIYKEKAKELLNVDL